MNRLCLKTPDFDELWYRKEILADQKTMSFNCGYEKDIPGYNYKTGTIDFDEEYWADWYDKWVLKTNENFYAYIVRKDDNKFIGEVAYSYNKERGYEVKILVEEKARGFGYAEEALKLLTRHAFLESNVEVLSDTLPQKQYDTIDVFSRVGFKLVKNMNSVLKFGEAEEIVLVELRKEDYLKMIKDEKVISDEQKSKFNLGIFDFLLGEKNEKNA